jgi:hypothetical protein
VIFLGHKISQKGVETDPKKVEAVKNWPIPRDKKGVKSFLGTVGYYRKYIPNYSTTAKPLNALTGQEVEFKWSPECQEAFEKLKECLVNAPILGYPRDDGMYLVDCDACGFGIGSVLSQIQDETEVVISYGSRTLNVAEMNYCVTRKELLAVVYHIKLWRCYWENLLW